MKNPANDDASPVPSQAVMKQLYEAAGANPWRPSHRIPSADLPESLRPHAQPSRIQEFIARARQKSFVRAIKPLRRLLRNQGAVNDSLIDAVSQLAAQTNDLKDQVADLRRQLNAMRKQNPSGQADRSPATE